MTGVIKVLLVLAVFLLLVGEGMASARPDHYVSTSCKVNYYPCPLGAEVSVTAHIDTEASPSIGKATFFCWCSDRAIFAGRPWAYIGTVDGPAEGYSAASWCPTVAWDTRDLAKDFRPAYGRYEIRVYVYDEEGMYVDSVTGYEIVIGPPADPTIGSITTSYLSSESYWFPSGAEVSVRAKIDTRSNPNITKAVFKCSYYYVGYGGSRRSRTATIGEIGDPPSSGHWFPTVVWDTGGCAAGPYTITVYVYDTNGLLVSKSATGSMSTPVTPSIESVTPEDGHTVISGTGVVIRAKVDTRGNPNIGCFKVTVCRESDVIVELTDTGLATAYSWSPSVLWYTGALRGGEYDVTAGVFDRSGEELASTSVTYKVIEKPQVTSLIPNDGAAIALGEDVTITAVIDTNDYPAIGKATFEYCDAGHQICRSIGEDTSPPGSGTWSPTVTWHTSGLASGRYQIYVSVCDTSEPPDELAALGHGVKLGRAPHPPDTPEGPSEGCKGVPYAFLTSTTDPDSDRVQFRFDFGDGSVTSEWTALDVTGSSAYAFHTFSKAGTFAVMAQARDEHGITSLWNSSAAHEIAIASCNLADLTALGMSADDWTTGVEDGEAVEPCVRVSIRNLLGLSPEHRVDTIPIVFYYMERMEAEYDPETGMGFVPIEAPDWVVDGQGVAIAGDVEPVAGEWAYRRVTFESSTVEVDDAFWVGGKTVQLSVSIEALRGKGVSTLYFEVNPGPSRDITEEDYENNKTSVELETEAEETADPCAGFEASIRIARSTFSGRDDSPPDVTITVSEDAEIRITKRCVNGRTVTLYQGPISAGAHSMQALLERRPPRDDCPFEPGRESLELIATNGAGCEVRDETEYRITD
jgi:hypothetical protein